MEPTCKFKAEFVSLCQCEHFKCSKAPLCTNMKLNQNNKRKGDISRPFILENFAKFLYLMKASPQIKRMKTNSKTTDAVPHLYKSFFLCMYVFSFILDLGVACCTIEY